MNPYKNPLEQAQRHVQEGEQRVAHQRVLLAELVRTGQDTTVAREVLQECEAALAQMRTHLQTLQTQQA